MRKLLKLYRLMQKNESPMLAASDDKGTASSPLSKMGNAGLAVLAAIALGFLTYQFADTIESFGGGRLIYLLTGLLSGIIILALGIFTLIKNMYMSSDIEILITLPFSSAEIAILRVLSYLYTAFKISLVLLVAPQVGLSIVHPQAPRLYLVVGVSCLLVPRFVTGLIATAVILVMGFVSALRNIEALRYVGAVAGFLLLMGYYFLYSNREVGTDELMSIAAGTSQSMKYMVPVVGLCDTFLESGSILHLAAAIGLTLLACGLFLLVSGRLYLKGALNMQNANAGRALTQEELTRICSQKNPTQALIRKEYRMVRRSPAFFTNNFLYGFLWPVIVLVMMKNAIPMVSEALTEFMNEDGASWASMETFARITPLMCGVVTFILLIPLLSSTLAYSCLSREGNSFFIMKQIPVSYREQLRAKRIMANRFAQITSTVYAGILLLLLAILCKIPIYYIVIPIVLSAAFTAEFICCDMLLGIRKADVNWNDEKTGASKNSGLALLVNFLHLAVPFLCCIATFADGMLNMPIIINLACVGAIIVILLLLWLLFSRLIYTVGEKKIKRLRF